LETSKKHPRVLIHFLNSVIRPKSLIKNVEIENPNYEPEYIGDKSSRLDIVAKTEDGEILNIEMQRKDEKDITARALFYWSELFFGQLGVGKSYDKLKRTISINVLDFNLFNNDERYWRKGYLKDEETNEKFPNLLEMHFVELNKMKEMKTDSPITFWIEFFRNPYSENVRKLCEYVPEIREAKEVFERAKSDPKAREMIRLREKSTRDQVNAISSATKLGREEGKKESREEGLKKGLEKGKKEGLAEGELRKTREIAISMLEDGIPTNVISKYTGLSTAEAKKLKHTER
jgi:predicted transposase/invertase (TIGR01784 family)